MARMQAIALSDLVQDQAVRVVLDDVPIAIVLDGRGEVHAIGDTCSHGQISLSEGWAHGSAFSLRTGQPLNLPAYEPVPVYVVEIEDGTVYIDPHVTKEIAA
jgi:3-phenylpropionate/trans-cinnamate dioxygenase ferredoxin subunit